jgi:epoxyqueuosine reductase
MKANAGRFTLMDAAAAATDAAATKAALLEVAFRAGASAVRVADAEPDLRERARLEAAYARGDVATWRYADERAATSTDPGTLLPGARSVICLALAYATPPPARRARLTGRVSNYAWAGDYHARLRALAGAVAAELDRIAGEPASRVVCDTAPLAERAFAARAGLGWVGKHTGLIAPGLGSFVFLAEVVTTVALPPDPPLRKSCGSCTRCVDVCPTGALRGDYTMDSTRCISDLTQRRDAIPLALRPLIGDWVWGCDLCGEVCPPSRRAGPGGGPAFAPAGAAAAFPDLQALLRLRGRAFRRAFGATAIGWRGSAVLRRNAAVALGNALDRAAVPALEAALADDPQALVRGHAAWALGRIGSPRAIRALEGCLASETDPGARTEIEAAMGPFLKNG